MVRCEDCQHCLVCYINKDYLKMLSKAGLDITINKCKNYDKEE